MCKNHALIEVCVCVCVLQALHAQGQTVDGSLRHLFPGPHADTVSHERNATWTMPAVHFVIHQESYNQEKVHIVSRVENVTSGRKKKKVMEQSWRLRSRL